MKMDKVQNHKIVMDALKSMLLTDMCINVSKLARRVNIDQRTVRNHLVIAEIDDFGYFADTDKKIFCRR